MAPEDLSNVLAISGQIEAELQSALSAVQSVEMRCKEAFLPLLRDQGISLVEIHYDGGGDEGNVGDVIAFAEDGETELPTILCDHHSLQYNGEVQTTTIALEDALRAFAEHAICTRHNGWEDGEGAYGSIVIDVASGATTLTHHCRFIDYETTEAEL